MASSHKTGGRQKGTPNKATVRLAAKLAEAAGRATAGLSPSEIASMVPLDVMQYAMRLALLAGSNRIDTRNASDWWIVATNNAHSPTIACCQSHLNAGGRWSCTMMSGLTRELLKSGKPLARGVAATELLMS